MQECRLENFLVHCECWWSYTLQNSCFYQCLFSLALASLATSTGHYLGGVENLFSKGRNLKKIFYYVGAWVSGISIKLEINSWLSAISMHGRYQKRGHVHRVWKYFYACLFCYLAQYVCYWCIILVQVKLWVRMNYLTLSKKKKILTRHSPIIN